MMFKNIKTLKKSVFYPRFALAIRVIRVPFEPIFYPKQLCHPVLKP